MRRLRCRQAYREDGDLRSVCSAGGCKSVRRAYPEPARPNGLGSFPCYCQGGPYAEGQQEATALRLRHGCGSEGDRMMPFEIARIELTAIAASSPFLAAYAFWKRKQ